MNRKQTSSAHFWLPPHLFLLSFGLRQDARFKLNFTLCPLTPGLTHSHLGLPTHTWAQFYSKVVGPCLKHEIQVRVLLYIMPGPLITAYPDWGRGGCNHIGFFHCLPQMASRWETWDPQHHRLEYAHHVLNDKQPSGTV